MCEKPAIRRQHSARYYSTKLLCFITLLIFTQNGAASSAYQASERTINQNLTDKVYSSSRISTVVLQQKNKSSFDSTYLTGGKKTKPNIFEWKAAFINISKQSEFISFSFVVKKQAETQIFASFFPLIDNVFICSMELRFALHMLCNCQQSDPNTALNVLLRSSSFPESQPA